ncbi:MAG: preprotein translocase subunit SecE [Clostridia bacterium]|nr:preprotein translocase subunit SecE [Clostridia bacterium]
MSEKETGAMKAPLKADKPAKKEPKKPGKTRARFAELKSEIKKIRWPGFKQVVNNTLVVIATVLLVGVIIWLFDFLLSLLNTGIHGLL